MPSDRLLTEGGWLLMWQNKWVWSIGLVVFLCSICWAYVFAEVEDNEVRFARQMVGRAASERTIIWQSDALDEKTRLAYRQSGDKVVREVRPEVERCVVGDDTFFRYRVEVDGLVRGAGYEYRIGGEGSAWHRLRVPAEEYTMLIFSDSQCSGDYRVWQEVVRAAMEDVPSAELCLHLGDLVDCGASRYQWERWLTGAEGVLLSCAFAPTLGNHEDYTTNWRMTIPYWYHALFPVVKNDDAELDGYVYSFDYGDVHYAVLDTQAEELSAWKADWVLKQAVWLERDLARSGARWKVVLCHKPFYEMDGTLSEHGKAWLPICRKYGVRLVLSGHHHIYARKEIDGITMITAGVSGDGTGYDVQGDGTDVVLKRCDMPNWLAMTVTHDAILLRAVQIDGVVIDEVMISSQE